MVTLWMVISLNGYIAKEDGNEDWISSSNWEETLRIAKKHKHIIYGRKTYDNILTWGEKYLQDLQDIEIIIVSRSNKKYKNATTMLSPQSAITYAKEKHGDVLVCGGSHSNSSFLKNNLIDEILLNIQPYILGKGIPLFASDDFENKLKFIDSKQLQGGIFQVHYKVVH